MSPRLTHISITQTLSLVVPFFMLLSSCLPTHVLGSDNNTGSSQAASEPSVVAEGRDGFRVTERDVQELIEFFTTHTMFQTTEKEYRRYTVQTFLFAREAERLGLISEKQELPHEPVPRRLAMANIYLEHRLRNLQLEPEAVQSYYRAFPERFLKDPGAEKWKSQPTPPIEPEDLLPFDEVAPQIEGFIRDQLRRRVEAFAFEDLMTAYQVVMK